MKLSTNLLYFRMVISQKVKYFIPHFLYKPSYTVMVTGSINCLLKIDKDGKLDCYKMLDNPDLGSKPKIVSLKDGSDLILGGGPKKFFSGYQSPGLNPTFILAQPLKDLII